MLVAPDAPRYAELGMREQAFARMLFYTLWDDGGGFRTYDDGLDHLRGYQFVCREIRQVVKLGVAASKHAAKSLGAGLQHIPLFSHATYRREEVLAAPQYGSLEQGKNVQHREGVAWCPATSTDAFFVSLNKDDKKHSATTMYKDYAISPELFHWESQNATSPGSPTGAPISGPDIAWVKDSDLREGYSRRRDRADSSVHLPGAGGLRAAQG